VETDTILLHAANLYFTDKEYSRNGRVNKKKVDITRKKVSPDGGKTMCP